MSDLTDAPLEILLVEDNPGDAQLTQRLLHDADRPLHFTVAEDGEVAMACLRRQAPHAGVPRPDLILLDLTMPKKDGFAVLAEMREDPQLSEIPVFILTSNQLDANRLSSMGVHPRGWWRKPVNVARFNELIGDLEHAPTAKRTDLDEQPADAAKPKRRSWFGKRAT